MQSTVAKVCKGSAVILFILDFIGAIVMGNAIGEELLLGGFSKFIIVLSLLLSCFLFCLLLYAVGSIVEKLSNIDYYTQLSYEAAYIKQDENAGVPYADGWVCKKCGKRNHKNSVACPECGEVK